MSDDKLKMNQKVCIQLKLPRALNEIEQAMIAKGLIQSKSNLNIDDDIFKFDDSEFNI